ncbi:hypothetical protein Pst134EA_007863 [Puccinia striiformis f. sp. tritici]|uniref:hypothetical protein n=1 Tax=Puccinia striiformis f. sp. tritici TaxID=168172 RepID=UPI002007E80A|nr:hypothetical protein Pst134EA_007863 [Puccinia striiformis f. sp. tritici]KAH9470616.1 hypothetical protein Pst134EA_007863 [Puccinia striiformis f. sp. tritici]
MVQLHRLVRLRLPALRPALASSSAQLRLRRLQLPPPRRTAANSGKEAPHNKHFIMGHHQSQEKKKPDTIPSSHGNFDRIMSKVHSSNGYFTGKLLTEIFNDSGVPHTLEHLIFLGSEKYPYKGILDSLANRAFAKGTNAWTDTTHTAYTVTTAGSEGFLRLLPVFLDHVLYPTITSEGFTTEVYHINGKGEDAGVVYSEMQGRENGAMDLMSLRNQQLLYPPTSGYRSETGGLMEALRVLTVEQIREYHEYYYRPHNLQLIVTGKLDPTELLEVLNSQVEPSLVQHGQDRIPSGWKRPFLETPSQGGARIEKSQTVEVEFPEKDESIGEVQISWVGPSTDDFLLQTALDVLGTYLTDSAVSPSGQKIHRNRLSIMHGYNLSPDRCGEDSFKKALAEEAASIDMGRLKMVIERAALKTSNAMEVDASDCLSSAIISNFLYGSGSDLVTSLSAELQRYETLAGWSAAQWSTVFRTWLVDPPSTCIIGKPSAKLSDKLEADTKQRLEATRQKYGPEGLKKLAEKTNPCSRSQ